MARGFNQPTPSVALAMIVKNSKDEAKLLSRCLQSVKGKVDAVYLYVNDRSAKSPISDITKLATTHRATAKSGRWNDDFAEARNASFAGIKEDWVLWLDTDDTVEHPEKIKEVAQMADNADGVMIKYDYDHDEFGNTTTVHTNLRLVRNNGAFAWRGKLHETLIETRRVKRVRSEDFKVIHHADNDRKDQSNARNISIMEQMLDAEGTTPDPRTLYYLGTAYIDAERYQEAIELLELYLNLSGWDEERSQAHVWLGRIYRDSGDLLKGADHFLKALWENPKEATAKVELGATEMKLEHWGKAITWLEEALMLKKSEATALVTNPLETSYRTYMMLAECHVNIGGDNLGMALKLVEAAYKLRPDTWTTDYRNLVKRLVWEKTTVGSFINAVKQVQDPAKAEVIYGKLDDELKMNPGVISVMRKFREPKTWAKKSVAIYCGNNVLKNWGPWSLESGIGGSEEAVIRISKHLKDLGWEVVVYSEPGARDGVYDGVTWRNYWELDLRDTFDVFVVWRAPWFFDAPIQARKKYLWLHDVMDDSEFTPERLAKIDKVMLLSQAHKTVFPSIPEDKVFYTGNGIDPDEFIELDGTIERDNHRVIYQSSHVRGLDNLLDMWPEVKKAVPDATLDLYYGWESYDSVNRNNPERMAWKDLMVKRIEALPGVTDHGRVGHNEVAEATFGAGVWAYPTQFFEIYCITSVKAQAGGAWPVTTTFGALDEMVEFGYRQPMTCSDPLVPIGEWSEGGREAYREALINALLSPPTEKERLAMMNTVRAKRSWKSTAESWSNDFSA